MAIVIAQPEPVQQYQSGYERGGSGVPYQTGIQSAINHRDDVQQRSQEMQQQNDQQAAGIQAAGQMQQQKYSLEAELADTQLSQQEKLRMSRMQNAVGDVSSDPSLSDEEKADMISQIKTGLSPLDARAKRANVLAQEQQKNAAAEAADAQAALRQRELTALGKTADQRQSISHDPTQLAAITAHLDSVLPPYSIFQGGPAARQAHIEQMAKAESIRQGTYSLIQTSPDGKSESIIKGPGSKEHESVLKGEGSGAKGGSGELTLDNWLKMRKHSEDAIDRRSKETVEGQIPGTKAPAHPDLQDDAKRSAAVEAHMKAAGMPHNYQEFQASQKPKQKGYGYDPDKAPWGKKAAAAAAESAAEPDEKPFDFSKPHEQTDKQKQQVANLTEMDKKLADSPAPPEVKKEAAVAHQEVRADLAEYGSIKNMPEEKRKRYAANVVKIAQAIRYQSPAAAATGVQPAAPAAPQSGWDKFMSGTLITTKDLTDPFTSSNPFTKKKIGAR